MNKDYLNKIHIVIYSKMDKHGGGRETWASYFLKNLSQSSEFESINIYCLKPEDYTTSLLEEFEENPNVMFYTIDYKKSKNKICNVLRYLVEINYLIKKNSCSGDLVLFLGAMMEGLVSLCTKLIMGNKLKVILWVRSIGLEEVATRQSSLIVSVLRIVEKIVFNNSNAIIFNGRDTFEYYKNKYKRNIDKMHVVENAIDYNMFSKVNPVVLSNNSLKIAYIGRFNKEKGFLDFLDSINIYNSNIDDEDLFELKFHIWGFGMEFEIPQNTTYHGILERKDILKVLESIDVLVFLNLSKNKMAGGLSHGILEAMASGRICLAYDNPAHSQVLNEQNSVLTPEGDVEKLVERYIEIKNNLISGNEDMYSKMIEIGNSDVEKFSIENHLEKFMKVSRSI